MVLTPMTRRSVRAIWSGPSRLRCARSSAAGTGRRPGCGWWPATVLALNEDEPGDPVIGSLKGLVRVLAFEHPDLRTTLLDLDAGEDTADTLAPLITELGLSRNDDVIAWRGQHRYVERLSRAMLGAGEQDHVVRRDGAYIVTGGLGGIGLVVARWLVDSGAARVVLNGRSEPSDEQRRVLAELEEGAQIAVVQGDISASESGRATGEGRRGDRAGLAGGRARRGRDRRSDRRRPQQGEPGPGLGAQGSWGIAAARCHGRPRARLVGRVLVDVVPPGFARAGRVRRASAWLDALVAWRRASGLPAITINWGQWSDIGVARSLTFSALDPIAPAEGIEALEAVFAGDLSRVGVARLRLDRASAAFPEIQQLGYFATLAEELDLDSDDDDWAGPDALRDMDAAEAHRVVTARLGARVLAIMGYPKDSPIDASQPLTELGMDSLMAVRIRNTVRGDFGVEPPVALLLQGASLTELTADLIRQLGLSEQDNTESANDVRESRPAACRSAAASRGAAKGRRPSVTSYNERIRCRPTRLPSSAWPEDFPAPTRCRRSGTTCAAVRSRSSRCRRRSLLAARHRREGSGESRVRAACCAAERDRRIRRRLLRLHPTGRPDDGSATPAVPAVCLACAGRRRLRPGGHRRFGRRVRERARQADTCCTT